MDIVVVGSINQDLVFPAARIPRPGETVLGGDWFTTAGGKGANQAVAAARLGAEVAFVGRLGDDAPGAALRDLLAAEGVDLTHLRQTEGVPTGAAAIVVDADGENTITVSPGANGRLEPDDIDAAATLIASARVVLAQLEVPLESVMRAAALTTGTFVLNPAPARSVPDMAAVDVLVPNRSELAALFDDGAETPELADLASQLGTTLVVTLGSEGAIVARAGQAVHIGAPQVTPVDTTAAGDAFCGALATRIAVGDDIEIAVRYAVAAGAAATTTLGAQPSLPGPRAVAALLG